MSSTISDDQICFQELEREYPGITKFRGLLTDFCPKQIATLAELIKYNVPRAYYTQEIMRVDELIQEIYFDNLQRGILDPENDNDLPAEIIRKITPISDQQEAEVILHNQSNAIRPQNKFSIQEIRDFIKNFNKVTDSRYVSPAIVNTISEFSQCRKQKTTYQNYEQKEKDNNKNVVPKLGGGAKENSQTKTIIIKMGDKIPIEVREMRNYVKKISQESFAVNSHKMELEKTDLQRQQTLISLSLNKVAKENLVDIFGDIEHLIIGNQQLADYFVKQLINKCVIEPKMAEVYLQFLCLFTKISKKYFNWQWSHQHKSSGNNINSVHRIAIDQLQDLFNAEINSISSAKRLKHITFMVGNLIYNKKLSRKAFTQVINALIEKILHEDSQKQAQQNYFQSLISLIESLKQAYQQNWAATEVSEILTQVNYNALCQIISDQSREIMETLLIDLAEYCNFQTSRIKCLIQNLFERKQPTQKPLNPEKQDSKQSPALNESKVKQLISSPDGFSQIFQLYSQNRSPISLLTILMALFDDKRDQVRANTDNFITQFNISKEEFVQFWQQQYMSLVLGECDLPYMVESLVKIMKHYSEEKGDWIIELSKDSEDYEDAEYFMEKITHGLGENDV